MIVIQYCLEVDGWFDVIDQDADDDIDEKSDKDDLNNDSKMTTTMSRLLSKHLLRAMLLTWALQRTKAMKIGTLMMAYLWKTRRPCEDCRFEKNARHVLDAHVDVDLFQVEGDIDLDTVDDDEVADVQWHMLVHDEDRELCIVETVLSVMQVVEAVMQKSTASALHWCCQRVSHTRCRGRSLKSEDAVRRSEVSWCTKMLLMAIAPYRGILDVNISS